MFQVMLLQRTADRAYSVLQALEPFMPFRDASMGTSTFDLTVLDCLRVGAIDMIAGPCWKSRS
jgi:cell division cycle 14